ncbi:MAG TPA: prolyl oligopeptidase family serine peptidase, partial [Prolixibacteraceae bacterium]|nr:prolyl oligopeptidase family serine peptidase [Prolixibacteraceae bacterium]
MKKNIAIYRYLILAVTLLVSSACSDLFKDDSDPEPRDEYLVSYELEKSYLPSFIERIFDNLVDDYPELALLQDKVKHGVIIYSIKYNTTFKGENVVASGLACVPIGEGPFPVMSYQNGTNTLHSEAPSVNPDRDLYLLLEFAASTGYIIALPDYLGFGASENMFHPYLHEESTAQTVVDMLRAVNELTTNWLETNAKDELYLTGYSQGGWSTMQVQKAIEENYSDEFNLVASSPAAGPYDLKFVHDHVVSQTSYPMPYFLGYLFNSYLNLGIVSVPPGKVFQQPYASKITTIYDGSKSGDELNAELTTTIAELFTSDYLANYQTD